jgi:hypothetical protein
MKLDSESRFPRVPRGSGFVGKTRAGFSPRFPIRPPRTGNRELEPPFPDSYGSEGRGPGGGLVLNFRQPEGAKSELPGQCAAPWLSRTSTAVERLLHIGRASHFYGTSGLGSGHRSMWISLRVPRLLAAPGSPLRLASLRLPALNFLS